MSRIGKLPVVIPEGISVDIGTDVIAIKGAKGELKRSYNPSILQMAKDGNRVLLSVKDKENGAYHGLMRKLVYNMIEGLSKGFEKKLEINGVGYKAAVQGKKLNIVLGFSHPVEVDIPAGLTVVVTENTKLSVTGADKELVGRYAAQIRTLKKPEPYLAKGVKYADEIIKRKVGKPGA